ncbi:iron-containing alcohol dehydrogenase [Sinorhizobium meliloti]|uniref:iron-containing alcohol dehydrogenase n=1 Tax=Rhizobium meliloti TaxID=382 RepID=UPI003D6548EC
MGEGVLQSSSKGWRDHCVVTSPSPWRFASSRTPTPKQVVFADNLKRDNLQSMLGGIDKVDLVVGIGSGVVTDAAKFIAKAKNAKLLQVPSTASNNACFTRFAWTFENGARIPEREIPAPVEIIIDAELVDSAPARMNRAGAAEILCSHTALFDWRCGRDAGLDVQWDEDILQLTLGELADLENYAPDIARNSRDAFIKILEVGAKFAKGFTTHPKARFNGGSEHILAWGLEAAGNRVIHGEAVTLGILLMSHIQGNDPEKAAGVVRAAKMAYKPEEMGVTWDDVERVVLNLPEAAKLVPWYTVLNEFEKRGAEGKKDLAERYKAAKAFVLNLDS